MKYILPLFICFQLLAYNGDVMPNKFEIAEQGLIKACGLKLHEPYDVLFQNVSNKSEKYPDVKYEEMSVLAVKEPDFENALDILKKDCNYKYALMENGDHAFIYTHDNEYKSCILNPLLHRVTYWVRFK